MSVIFSSHRFRAPSSMPVPEPPKVPEDENLLGQRLVAAGLLDPDDLAAALALQSHEDSQLGDILVANGMTDAGAVLRTVSDQSGIPVLPHLAAQPDFEAARRLDMDECLEHEFLPLRLRNGEHVVAICDPDGAELIRRRLPDALSEHSFILVNRQTLQRGIEICFRNRLATRAEARPPAALSCRSWSLRWTWAALTSLLAMICLGGVYAPHATFLTLTGLGLLAILTNSLLKASCLLTSPRRPRNGPLPEKLPRISLLVPLFKEAEIASSLIARLSRLNYPTELLEICLVAEADDTKTLTTLKMSEFPAHMRSIIVPSGDLRTKPRALNYALDFTRGSIIGIYDAEDAPAPDQLYDVVRTFTSGGRGLACVQGVLSYYNWPRNWLSRCFFLEYAAWFRVMLPGLRALGFAIPLGGTTLFFKRNLLLELGGWDAHNVTEDADLGIRLARYGYHTEVITTVTEEEANCKLWPWVRQRSRWLKGYAVTWAVHMRQPAQLLRDLGLKRFLGFQILFLGTLASFFLAPAFWFVSVLLISGMATPELLQISKDTYIAVSISFVLAEMLNLALIWKAVEGLKDRPSRLWSLTMPLYFAFASVASYKALFELCKNPFYWDKTEHGHLGGATDESPSKSVFQLPRINTKPRLKRDRKMLAKRF